MLNVDHARQMMLAKLQPLEAEPTALVSVLGRVLAATLRSPEQLPPFDNSAMDGYALALGGSPAAAGSEFNVSGVQAAGDAAAERTQGCAIMTGARVPDGLDAVVPVEEVEVLQQGQDLQPARIRLRAAVQPGLHIRRAGQDVALNEPVLPGGCRIGPAQLMLLAGLGVAQAELRRRPRVALYCTGRELVDDPAQALESGQIRNNNAGYLCARLVEAGAELVDYRTIADEPALFRAALEHAQNLNADVIVSTGAVSMGRYDFVPDSLRELGAQIVFHKLRMRPGKPLLHARMPSGAAFFGLPGNPASSAVGMRFFVEPALRALLGLTPERAWTLPLAAAARKKAEFTFIQKARVDADADGRLTVSLLAGQESFKVAPLALANAWAVLPEDAEELAAGSPVAVYGLSHWGLQLDHPIAL